MEFGVVIIRQRYSSIPAVNRITLFIKSSLSFEFPIYRIKIASGKNKPLSIQRVPAEHTAHGVGEQRDDFIPLSADIVAALHGLRHIVLGVKNAVDGNILVRHIVCQFVLQTVDVDKSAI